MRNSLEKRPRHWNYGCWRLRTSRANSALAGCSWFRGLSWLSCVRRWWELFPKYNLLQCIMSRGAGPKPPSSSCYSRRDWLAGTFLIQVSWIPGVDMGSVIDNGYPLLFEQLLVSPTCFSTPPKMVWDGSDPEREISKFFLLCFFS